MSISRDLVEQSRNALVILTTKGIDAVSIGVLRQLVDEVDMDLVNKDNTKKLDKIVTDTWKEHTGG